MNKLTFKIFYTYLIKHPFIKINFHLQIFLKAKYVFHFPEKWVVETTFFENGKKCFYLVRFTLWWNEKSDVSSTSERSSWKKLSHCKSTSCAARFWFWCWIRFPYKALQNLTCWYWYLTQDQPGSGQNHVMADIINCEYIQNDDLLGTGHFFSKLVWNNRSYPVKLHSIWNELNCFVCL